MLRVLSLGAGVQSTAVSLMIARGDMPAVDFAVFADTGWESAAVYRHLDWLEGVVPFPIVRARRPGLDLGQLALAVASGERPRSGNLLPPYYTADPAGMLPKQCSKEFKTRVVAKVIRDRLGIADGKRGPSEIACELVLGISYDEAWRMKPNEKAYIRNVWPLVEIGMDRRGCKDWMAERQFPTAPKSSCIFCPFRTNAQWADMRDNDPEEWAAVVAFDRAIRPGWPDMEGRAYLHRQLVPIEDAKLTAADVGQGEFSFIEECEGMCGV